MLWKGREVSDISTCEVPVKTN